MCLMARDHTCGFSPRRVGLFVLCSEWPNWVPMRLQCFRIYANQISSSVHAFPSSQRTPLAAAHVLQFRSTYLSKHRTARPLAPRLPHAKGRAYIRAQRRAGRLAFGQANQAKTHYSRSVWTPAPNTTPVRSSFLRPPSASSSSPSSSSAFSLMPTPPRRPSPPAPSPAASFLSFSVLVLRLLLPRRRRRRRPHPHMP